MTKTVAESATPTIQRLTVRGWFVLATATLAALATVAIVVGVLGVNSLAHARKQIVNRLDPASQSAAALLIAFLNQETGVRGYALSAQPVFLQPYVLGRSQQRTATRALRSEIAGARDPALSHDVQDVLDAGQTWQTTYAEPTLARVQAGRPVVNPRTTDAGKAAFDRLRVQVGRLQADLDAERVRGERQLNGAANALALTLAIVATLLIALCALVLFALRATVTEPVARLARDARVVAGGDFAQPLRAGGARDIAQLGADVDAMRQRIVDELAHTRTARQALERQRVELERSNAELEQFAYVASHDLQEPLRKVASFTQLLQHRYAGQLDERADTYIEFATDGAKRMQTLINDLLAFSRVGRRPAEEATTVALDDALDDALSALAGPLDETRAVIDHPALPPVRGERTLLAVVFQNLIANAIKFRSDDQPPHIQIGATRRDARTWEVHCTDNGIGIDSEYAERIFLIFQRLHSKSAYPGTGIGLAMSRKIIEYHGGQLWLDPGPGPGSTFRFTLPALSEEG